MVSQAAQIENIQQRVDDFVDELKTHNRALETKEDVRYVVSDASYEELRYLMTAKLMKLRFLAARGVDNSP